MPRGRTSHYCITACANQGLLDHHILPDVKEDCEPEKKNIKFLVNIQLLELCK